MFLETPLLEASALIQSGVIATVREQHLFRSSDEIESHHQAHLSFASPAVSASRTGSPLYRRPHVMLAGQHTS